jgi:hypothetical protein
LIVADIVCPEPEDQVIPPYTLTVAPESLKKAYAETVHVKQLTVPEIVTVGLPEFESKMALSDAVGTDAPPDPPEVVDQFPVFEEFQVPEPPRQ